MKCYVRLSRNGQRIKAMTITFVSSLQHRRVGDLLVTTDVIVQLLEFDKGTLHQVPLEWVEIVDTFSS